MNPKDIVGAKKAPLRYVPPALAIEASGPMEDGAIKYGPFNWRETGVEMVTYLEAIDRHLSALKDGQDFAEDSGYSHIGHIAANAGIIADAQANGTLIDNRYTKGPAADMLRARDKSAPKPLLRSDIVCTCPNLPRNLEHSEGCPRLGLLAAVPPWWGINDAGDGKVYGMEPLTWHGYGMYRSTCHRCLHTLPDHSLTCEDWGADE